MHTKIVMNVVKVAVQICNGSTKGIRFSEGLLLQYHTVVNASEMAWGCGYSAGQSSLQPPPFSISLQPQFGKTHHNTEKEILLDCHNFCNHWFTSICLFLCYGGFSLIRSYLSFPTLVLPPPHPCTLHSSFHSSPPFLIPRLGRSYHCLGEKKMCMVF